MIDEATQRRRAALGAIFRETADAIVDRVASEGARASGLRLAQDFVRKYSEGIRETLPAALDAVAETDPALQATKLDGLAASIRAVSDRHHVPHLLEKGLLAVAFKVASELVRRRAEGQGFTADELDAELSWIRNELERRLRS